MASSASWADPAVTTSAPHWPIPTLSNSLVSGSSSTTSTLSPSNLSGQSYAGQGVSGRRVNALRKIDPAR